MSRRDVPRRLGYENRLARWDSLDPTVKAMAELAVAANIGCGWCLDFGFWASFHRGVDPVKLREITNWQRSTVYSESERAAITKLHR